MNRVRLSLATGMMAVGLAFAAPAAATAKTTICRGSPSSPGVLAGDYYGDVSIDGLCAVNAGRATVHGTVWLEPNSALVAAFGGHGSVLDVTRSIYVGRNATLLLGCLPSSFPCIDDPNPSSPTLSSAPVVGASVIARDPLGVIVHDATVGGRIDESGGGGGMNCTPTGVFASFGSPVYSDYEDSTVAHGLSISGLTSCWLGVARVNVGESARFLSDNVADPDGVEILANHISGDLVCRDNSAVWDSAELTNSGLYPRTPEPNTVGGSRVGQCVLSSPRDAGGPAGPGPF